MINKNAIEVIQMQKEKAEDLMKKANLTSSEFNAWKNTTKQFLIKIFGENSDNTNYFSSGHWLPHDILYINGRMDEKTANIKSLEYLLNILNGCIQQLQVELSDASEKGEIKMPNKKKVFVVHGRNEIIRNSMFDFLRAIGVEPIEWLEAKKLVGSGSPYIGQILESAFDIAQAIVVLLTPDDFAYLSPQFHYENDPLYEKILTPQARPNVIFEAGIALGSKEDRTILIEFGEMRPFSDVLGRHVLRFNDNASCRLELVELLRNIGVDVSTDGKKDWLTVGSFNLESVKNFTVKNEGFRKGSDFNQVAIRFINNSSHKIEFSRCNISFKDRQGNELIADTKQLLKKYIYPFENRIEFLNLSGEFNEFNRGDFWNQFDISTNPVLDI